MLTNPLVQGVGLTSVPVTGLLPVWVPLMVMLSELAPDTLSGIRNFSRKSVVLPELGLRRNPKSRDWA